MARRRRERMSEGKKNIIAGLIEEYNIKTEYGGRIEHPGRFKLNTSVA